jgi:hypothetical protein
MANVAASVKKKLSRQARWQKKRVKSGKCQTCGNQREVEFQKKTRCAACSEQQKSRYWIWKMEVGL